MTMLILWPSYDQFRKWSLPSKLTFIGTYATLISLLITVGALFYPNNDGAKNRLPTSYTESVTFVNEKLEKDNNHRIEYPSVVPVDRSYIKQATKINNTLKHTALSIFSQYQDWETVIVNYDIKYNKYFLLCVFFDAYIYEPGAAHGLSKTIPFSINLVTGEPFEFKDLFRSEYKKKLDPIIVSRLKQSNKYFKCNDDLNSEAHMRLLFLVQTGAEYPGQMAACYKGVKDNQSFYITDEGIAVVFSQYEAGPYIEGVIIVNVPFEQVRKFINPNGPLANYYN